MHDMFGFTNVCNVNTYPYWDFKHPRTPKPQPYQASFEKQLERRRWDRWDVSVMELAVKTVLGPLGRLCDGARGEDRTGTAGMSL